MPTELDWQPGEFLDGGREFIICAIHGASYSAQTGRCIGGPCGQGRLLPIETFERGDDVWWQPTRDTRPAFPDWLRASALASGLARDPSDRSAPSHGRRPSAPSRGRVTGGCFTAAVTAAR